MIKLPKNSIIGNPLYLPNTVSGIPDDLIFKKANSGLYLSSIYVEVKDDDNLVESFGYTSEFKEGSLFAAETKWAGVKQSFRPIGLEFLLENKHLEELSYLELFEFLNVSLSSNVLSWIPESSILYRVTEKGNLNISLGKKKGKKKFSNFNFSSVKKPIFGL